AKYIDVTTLTQSSSAGVTTSNAISSRSSISCARGRKPAHNLFIRFHFCGQCSSLSPEEAHLINFYVRTINAPGHVLATGKVTHAGCGGRIERLSRTDEIRRNEQNAIDYARQSQSSCRQRVVINALLPRVSKTILSDPSSQFQDPSLEKAGQKARLTKQCHAFALGDLPLNHGPPRTNLAREKHLPRLNSLAVGFYVNVSRLGVVVTVSGASEASLASFRLSYQGSFKQSTRGTSQHPACHHNKLVSKGVENGIERCQAPRRAARPKSWVKERDAFLTSHPRLRLESFAKAGAFRGTSPADVVQSCDITFTCVSDSVAVRDVVFGNQGVLQGISKGKCYVEMSTVDEETVQDVADAVMARGGTFLEAPVCGSRVPALEGQLIILTSGDRKLYDDCFSCFEAMGRKSFYLGNEVGTATRMKLIHNMMLGTMVAGLAEGMALAEKVGLDQEDLAEIFSLGSLNCSTINFKSQAMVSQRFDPHFPLQHQQKDLRLVLSMGDSVEQPLYLAAAANELYKKARRLGFGEGDISAVYKAAAS
ncbi:hypothetical protein BaRGS_00021807, partial [Batillaria attramentaria]